MFAFAAAATFSFHAFAADKAKNAEKIKLTVGVENLYYLPYYSGAGEQYSGFMRDALDGFAKFANLELVYESLPVARLFRDMIGGELDLKSPDNPYWSAEDKKKGKLIYSDPVVSAAEGVLVDVKKVAKLKPEDVKTVGTVTGFTPFAILDLIKNKKLEVVENNDLDGLVKTTLMGRVDGAYMEALVAKNVLKEQGKTGDELTFHKGFPIDEHPFMVSFQEKHTAIRDKFNTFLKLESTQAIYKKWNVILKK